MFWAAIVQFYQMELCCHVRVSYYIILLDFFFQYLFTNRDLDLRPKYSMDFYRLMIMIILEPFLVLPFQETEKLLSRYIYLTAL